MFNASGGNEEFGIYRVDGCGNLVREFLELGKFHFLGSPASAFGSHAFRFVEYFPGHQGVVVADRLDDRDEDVVDKGRGAFVIEELLVRFEVEFVSGVDSPLVRFHQVVAEKAHRYHDTVFLGDVERLFHVADGVFLEARNEVRGRVNCGALAHVVEKPPADGISARRAGAFDGFAPGVFVERAIAYVGVVVCPCEVCPAEENFLSVVL